MLCPDCEEGSMHLRDLRTEEHRGRFLVCTRCGHIEEAHGLTLTERALRSPHSDRPAGPTPEWGALARDAYLPAAPIPLTHGRPRSRGPSPIFPTILKEVGASAVYPITVAEDARSSVGSSILPRASPATPGGLRC